MLKKRGDVTPYIVIGLIILLFLGVIIYVISEQISSRREHDLGKVTHLKTSAFNIKPYVEGCLRQKSFEGILDSAYKGENAKYNDKNKTKSSMELYIKQSLLECVDFSLFKEFDINIGEINPEVTFRDKQTVIHIEWPITISQDDLSIELREFRVTFPLALEEIFEKIENIENSGTLDLINLFEQKIDILLIGCRQSNGGTNLIYAIEDEEYIVDDKLVSFFFDVPIKNLTHLFEIESNNLKYNPPVKNGRQILRKQNDDNRFIFDVKDGVISGCGKEIDLLKEPMIFTFSLVEKNNVVASASTDVAHKIDIENIGNNSFLFSSEKEHNNLTLIFYTEELTEIRMNDSLVDFEIHEDYLIVNNARLGSYNLIDSDCKKLSIGDDKITFVSLNYEKDLFFKHAKLLFSQLLSEEQFEDTQFQIIYNNNTCDSLSGECKQLAEEIVNNVCGQNLESSSVGKVIGLVYNPILGVEHNNSLVSSYLVDNEENDNVCISCNVIEEINK